MGKPSQLSAQEQGEGHQIEFCVCRFRGVGISPIGIEMTDSECLAAVGGGKKGAYLFNTIWPFTALGSGGAQANVTRDYQGSDSIKEVEQTVTIRRQCKSMKERGRKPHPTLLEHPQCILISYAVASYSMGMPSK